MDFWVIIKMNKCEGWRISYMKVTSDDRWETNGGETDKVVEAAKFDAEKSLTATQRTSWNKQRDTEIHGRGNNLVEIRESFTRRKTVFGSSEKLLGVRVKAREPPMQMASSLMKDCNDSTKSDSALSTC